MSDTRTASMRGTFTANLLGVAFVVLKLTHVIDWSWWWVTAPFWIPLAFAAVFMLAVVVIAVIATE